MNLSTPPSAPDHLPGSAGRARRGQGLMEFALILPLLLLFLLGIIETGHLLVIFSSVSSAAKQSSRYGSVGGDSGLGIPYYLDCAGMRRSAQNTSFLQPLADTDISIRYDHGLITQSIGLCATSAVSPTLTQSIRDGDRVVISITTTYRPLLPIVPLPTIPMTFVAAHSIFTTILGPTPTPRPNPDLAIGKVVTPTHILSGEPPYVTYTLQITNTGPVVANNIVLTDTLPAGMLLGPGYITVTTRVPALLPVDWSCSSAHPTTSVFTCTLPYLGLGQTSSVITITATAPLTPAPALVRNMAQVAYNLTDPVMSNNTATADTFISAWVDLQANKTSELTSVTVPGKITYSISVKNNNWVDANTETVTDTIPTSPAGTSLDSISFAGWNSCTPQGGDIICKRNSPLTVGSTSPTITVVLNVPDSCLTCTYITNVVTATSDFGDPFPLNNTATISTAIVYIADMAMFKTGPTGVDANASFNYTLHATNNGPTTASGVTITDTVPTTVTAAAGTNWNCAVASNVVICHYSPLLALNASTTNIVITAKAPNATGTLVNTATVSADDIDPISANNTASISTNVTTCFPGIVDPSRSTVTAYTTPATTPPWVWADNFTMAHVVVTLLDACSNPTITSSQLITLSSSRGGSDTVSIASGYSNPTSTGQVVFDVKSGSEGTSIYSASTNGGPNLTQTAPVNFNSYPCITVSDQLSALATHLQFNINNNSGYTRRLLSVSLTRPNTPGQKTFKVTLQATTLWQDSNGNNSTTILIPSVAFPWDPAANNVARTLANGAANQILDFTLFKSVAGTGNYTLTTTWDDGTGAQACSNTITVTH